MRNYWKLISPFALILIFFNLTKPIIAQGPTSPSIPGNWKLVFEDNFDSSTLDTTKWHTCFWWATELCTIESNSELELYNPDDILLKNGSLILRARKQRIYWPFRNKWFDYSSGMVITGGRKYEKPPGFTFTYGYAEARVKVPEGKGLWPAFWMLPVSYESLPEIDITEILGDTPNIQRMHYHYNGGTSGQNWESPVPFSNGFHTFAIEWSADKLVWYVDNVERWRFTNSQYISNEPMYLLLNLAVGGNWPGAPDANTVFPADFEVDYVRVWQKLGTTATPTNVQPKFGDINKDGKVNKLDMQLVVENWLGTGSCGLYNCDLRTDQKINSLDASLVYANF